MGKPKGQEPKKKVGQGRGTDPDYNFKFSNAYTVSNPESEKIRMERRNRPKDVLENIVAHTRPNSLLPYRGLLNDDPQQADGTGNTVLELTGNFVDTLKDQEEQQRRIRTHKTAENLLHMAMQKRPDIQPVFVGSTMKPGEMKQVRLSEYKPTRETLIPPKLNPSTGAALIGTDMESLGIPQQDPKQMSPDDKILFDWWNSRQAVRERRRDEEKLSQFVNFPLTTAIRQMITREESQLLKEVSAGRVEGTKVSIAPSTKASSIHDQENLNVAGTSRGLVLPLKSMEQMFRGARSLMHETVISLLGTYRMSRRTVREVGEDDATAQDLLVLSEHQMEEEEMDDAGTHHKRRESRVVDMEEMSLQLLLDSEKQLARQAADDSLVPSCVSLPPERIFTPCLVMETAISVAIMWKILEQVRTVVPGMTFALHLFEHYLLPHVYDSFSSYSTVIPSLGGLSEQIMQLSLIPLRMEASRLASIAYEQSKADSKYIEYAMKHWTLRGWRRNIREIKQHEAYVKNVLTLITRVRRKRMIHAVFAAWRFEARNSSNLNYLLSVREEYNNFLNGTDFPAELSAEDAEGEPNITQEAKTRLLATRLAETAVHVKGVKKPSAIHEEPSAIVEYKPSRSSFFVTATEPVYSQRSRGSAVDPFSSRGVIPSGESSFAKVMTGIRSLSVSLTSGGRERSMSPRPGSESRTLMPRGANKANSTLAPFVNSMRGEDGNTPMSRVHDLQNKASGTFEEMLRKLREMEDVCNHLRGEIGVQSKMLRKVEKERDNLRERNKVLEEELLRVTEEKLHYCNMVQEKQFVLNDRERRIAQLKSRIRAHRNRPWQKVVLRVVGEMCRASTQVSEALDNIRIRKDQKPDSKGGAFTDNTGRSANSDGEESDDGNPSELTQQKEEEERLFGKLAPIVLSSSYPLPDALIILQDWANACLDDLQDLDDLKGGALSTRFSTFSEEARNAILLSRLLFYLSLPRYMQRTANRDQEKAADGEEVFGTSYPDRRRQLLRRYNVQLDTPFPVYPDCFGDLMSMRPSERMTLLLQFATELMSGSDMLTDDGLDQQRQKLYKTVFAMTNLQQPPAAGRIELQEVIDPHALAMGERASVVTFVALLYCRFAHPFNHKCKQSAEVEKAAILHLLSGGVHHRRSSMLPEDGHAMTIEEEIMMNLEDEDKSPWYLFKERCLPVFGTHAHPFLLRGNFWPSDAFDSPYLANILGELGMALNRSLELHRWHVIMSCLVPVMTYSGLSRGVFTGTRASSQALRVGLEREGEWNVPLHCRCFMRVYAKRAEALRAAVSNGLLTVDEALADNEINVVAPPSESLLSSPFTFPASGSNFSLDKQSSFDRATPQDESGGPLSIPPNQEYRMRKSVIMDRESQELLHAIHLTSSDLLTLFLRRSTLSAELALPTLTLGGWRLLCTDLKLLASSPEEEENAVLDMDVASKIFYEAVMALNEVATTSPESPKRPPPRRARANTFTSKGIVAARRASLGQAGSSQTTVQIPPVSDDMTFTAFLIAMSLVANEMYPLSRAPMVETEPGVNFKKDYIAFQEKTQENSPSFESSSEGRLDSSRSLSLEGKNIEVETSESAPTKEKKLIWLGNCLEHFINVYIPKVAGEVLSDDPRAVIHRLTMGAGTQEVLALYTPAIILVFNAYSKDIYGAAGMEKDDLLQLLRDAMFTSTEISPHLIFEVFQHCCVTRHAYEEEAAAKRREIDGRPRDGRRRGPRAVSIVDPRKGLPGGHQKDIDVLVYEGFVQFLCVMCSFKQPNPLRPYAQRLDVFLRRSVLNPLRHRVENLAQLLNQSRPGMLKQDDEANKKMERRESMRREGRRGSVKPR